MHLLSSRTLVSCCCMEHCTLQCLVFLSPGHPEPVLDCRLLACIGVAGAWAIAGMICLHSRVVLPAVGLKPAVVGTRATFLLPFFSPILEHFCLFFIQIAQMGLILPRLGLVFPKMPAPIPVLYSAVTHPFWGYVRKQNN